MRNVRNKSISILLSIIMVLSVFTVGLFNASAADITIGNNSQKHVVNNYQKSYQSYAKQYIDGNGVALDGSNGLPDMVIPGLDKNDDMTPQGFAYYAKNNWMLITSYMGSNSSHTNTTSVIYALDFTTGNFVAKFNIYKKNGSPFTAHAGGVAVSDNNLYICDSGSKISYLPLSVLDDIQTGSENNITIADTCDIGGANNNSGTSYLSLNDGILWTGNFYEAGNSSYNTAANPKYNSLILGYDLNDFDNSISEWNALVSMSNSGTGMPSYVLACPNNVYDIQAVVVKDNNIFIGSSWGRKNDSHLYVGSVALNEAGNTSIKLTNGVSVDAYAVNVKKSFVHLPMTEGMFIYEGEDGINYLYNIFESAAYTYNGSSPLNVCPKPTDVVWKINADNLLDSASKCTCNCHKTGFVGFIWKIQCFFYRIFKINEVCDCGVKHW